MLIKKSLAFRLGITSEWDIGDDRPLSQFTNYNHHLPELAECIPFSKLIGFLMLITFKGFYSFVF